MFSSIKVLHGTVASEVDSPTDGHHCCSESFHPLIGKDWRRKEMMPDHRTVMSEEVY